MIWQIGGDMLTVSVNSHFFPLTSLEMMWAPLHRDSLSCSYSTTSTFASLLLFIYMHAERWQMKQWTFVERNQRWSSNEWLSHPWHPCLQLVVEIFGRHKKKRLKDGGGWQQTDKAAVLSCQREVFELSLGKQLRMSGDFCGCRAQSKLYLLKNDNYSPRSKSFIEMQSLALSVSRK